MQLQHKTLVLRGSCGLSVTAWTVERRPARQSHVVTLRSVKTGRIDTLERRQVEQWIQDGLLVVAEAV